MNPLLQDPKKQLEYAIAVAHARKRKKAAAALGLQPENPWSKYRGYPVKFFTEGLRYSIWSKQREICEALLKYDRVAVKSCHESGKSFVVGGLVGWWIAVHPPGEAMVVTTAPTFPQVRTILWREINRAHTRGGLPGYTNQTEWIIDREVVAFGRKPEDAAPDAFQGIHARYMLVALDEACGVPGSLWTAAETLVANEGGKILAIGNPDDPNTEFGAICKPGSGWFVITISAFDTPNFTGEEVPDELRSRLIGPGWVEQRKKRWGEKSPLYQSKVLGEFPEVSHDSLISPKLVTDAVNRTLVAEGPNELGVDVARFGRNETVIYHRHGPVARLYKTVASSDTMHVAGLVVQAVRDTGATCVKIDEIGVGSGVVDRLKELQRDRSTINPLAGVTIIGVNVGAAVIERPRDRSKRVSAARGGKVFVGEKQRYFNLKTQLCWELRDLFVDGEIDLDDDEDTQAQITEIRYDVLSNGKVKIESKEDIAKRLEEMAGMTGVSGSPDRFDALVLAFADLSAMQPMKVHPSVLARSMRPGMMGGLRR